MRLVTWIPQGYHEEERICYPLLIWSGRHMWWTMRLLGKLNPEWSHDFSTWIISHWPRITYHILLKDDLES